MFNLEKKYVFGPPEFHFIIQISKKHHFIFTNIIQKNQEWTGFLTLISILQTILQQKTFSIDHCHFLSKVSAGKFWSKDSELECNFEPEQKNKRSCIKTNFEALAPWTQSRVATSGMMPRPKQDGMETETGGVAKEISRGFF